MQQNNINISKKMAFCLRHHPEQYNLQLDNLGYVDIQDFVNALNRVHEFNPKLTKEKIQKIIKTSSKQRFELKNNQIRALYGHSFTKIINHQKAKPPDILYHGTSKLAYQSIKLEGLLPMKRQFVHLSTNIKMAQSVGKRHDAKPIILQINAKQAYLDGIKFYIGNNQVWLCHKLPTKYITKIN